MSQTGSDRDLMAEEEQLWTELHGLIDTLPQDKVEEPGYFPEGWTAKDLVAHLGSWLAEAGSSWIGSGSGPTGPGRSTSTP